ncbi:MAG: hypothetical protein WAV05_08920, partial [Anaerolineales bacterium]
MPDDINHNNREQDFPISVDSDSSKTEKMQELVNFLVSNYREIGRVHTQPGTKTIFMGRELKVYEDWLDKAHTYFREATNQDLTLTLAAEWVLDNYYIIRQALLQIEKDLPTSFYEQLPKLAGGPLKGLPRIYAIGRAVLSFQNYLLNANDLQAILIQVQEHIPLTIGELWALPIFLRYSLIETLAHLLELIIHPQPLPDLPVFPVQLMGTGNPFTANQTTTNDTLAGGVVANIILSLRAISEQNWNDFFEAVSSLERTLREDPAGIYPWMDFKTRDLYRKEIELLSFTSGREENELAEITIDLARKSSTGEPESAGIFPGTNGVKKPLDDSISHVGEYLLGKGWIRLEHRIGYHPDVKTALKRWGAQHAGALYLGSIFLLSLLILGLISNLILRSALLHSGSPWHWISVLVLAIALLVPILTVSASLVNWLITLRIN